MARQGFAAAKGCFATAEGKATCEGCFDQGMKISTVQGCSVPRNAMGPVCKVLEDSIVDEQRHCSILRHLEEDTGQGHQLGHHQITCSLELGKGKRTTSLGTLCAGNRSADSGGSGPCSAAGGGTGWPRCRGARGDRFSKATPLKKAGSPGETINLAASSISALLSFAQSFPQFTMTVIQLELASFWLNPKEVSPLYEVRGAPTEALSTFKALIGFLPCMNSLMESETVAIEFYNK
ncbi:uncharacterized protein LOC132592050 isoform X2 [Zootoca vivipara]|uniref:uncharacterized protein LOC132592050 isoform X2 n=1 Tax=Zootoca vivipara TaxID=8524 RepID=UPI00293BF7AB|nr:uncharacterized protein LOC132592050 isoform X2 [Zootoca vivipara]